MTDKLQALLSSYFDYVAKSFPVMCSSDEFHFVPRAERAAQYYHCLENLDSDAITDYVATLKAFQRECDLLTEGETDFERLTDLALLKASMAGILIELDLKASWRHNPLLYLKTAFIGLDYALTKPSGGHLERATRAYARLEAIPRLLEQGTRNIDSVPQTYHGAALAMVADCQSYLRQTGPCFSHFTDVVKEASSALDTFGTFLEALTPLTDQEVAPSSLEVTVRDHFLSNRTLPETYEIAVEEWQKSEDQLQRLQKSIDPDKSWKELYFTYGPSGMAALDTVSLYEGEIERLGAFFQAHGFGEVDLTSPLELCDTPTYLQSVRSAASFSAALCADPREKDLFYMTMHLPWQKGQEAATLLKKRLHREYKFLSAHETIPGHHLLDSLRRKSENPIRRQIESALFYEGWAYYAETLLAECGYVESPIELLVDHKRRLWRAARCQIDVGLATGRLARTDAVGLVVSAGFTEKEAQGQIDRFRLNPGYQLCYTLGRYEIMRLRKTYGARWGLDRFHKQLLKGGELPFHLIEKRFRKQDVTDAKGDKE
ncbi:MAG: DUF885 family protein [Thermodesulfobacteriota bacterium]|nr:DUF885 family protein [Thermodesulfobacteriota bacterium]